MKIFLVYPLMNSSVDFRYHYGLGYISSALKQRGYDINYALLNGKEDIFALYEQIKQEQPQIIAFSVVTSQFSYLKDIVKGIKNVSDAFIIFGGIHPTLKPECISQIPGLDAIIRGEGEFPLCEFAEALENKNDYLGIKNFWFKGRDGIIKNSFRPLIANLDELPFPDKSYLDYQQIIDNAGGVNRFIFSRGCVFDCPYCANKALSSLYGSGENYFRLRSPKKAIEEIKLDEDRYKFNEIFFDDDLITLNKKWFTDFFELYKSNFRYPFYCNVRPGTIDVEGIKFLKQAGAKGIIVGLEHGNEEFRKTVLRRNITNEQIINLFKLCDQYGMKFNYAQIMIGLPFETKKLFLDTVKLSRKLNRKTTRFYTYIFDPYPGTEFEKVCKENNWLPDKESYKERCEAVISYPEFTKEEIQLCRDTFHLLMRFPFISLNFPLEWVRGVYKFLRFMKNLLLVNKKNKKI